jgi:hypothetical protein
VAESASSDLGSTAAVATWASVQGEPTAERFRYTVEAAEFLVSADGHGVRTRNGEKTTFSLPLDEGSWIVKLQALPFKEDLIVIYEFEDGEESAAKAVRLHGTTLEPRWNVRIPAFNVALGVRDGQQLCIAGFGFIGALDVENPVFVWTHGNLYLRFGHAFNDFETPVVTAREIVFKEGATALSGRRPWTIRVTRATGGMVVEKPRAEANK